MPTSTRDDGGIEVPVVSAEPADAPLRDPDRIDIAYPIERLRFGPYGFAVGNPPPETLRYQRNWWWWR